MGGVGGAGDGQTEANDKMQGEGWLELVRKGGQGRCRPADAGGGLEGLLLIVFFLRLRSGALRAMLSPGAYIRVGCAREKLRPRRLDCALPSARLPLSTVLHPMQSSLLHAAYLARISESVARERSSAQDVSSAPSPQHPFLSLPFFIQCNLACCMLLTWRVYTSRLRAREAPPKTSRLRPPPQHPFLSPPFFIQCNLACCMLLTWRVYPSPLHVRAAPPKTSRQPLSRPFLPTLSLFECKSARCHLARISESVARESSSAQDVSTAPPPPAARPCPLLPGPPAAHTPAVAPPGATTPAAAPPGAREAPRRSSSTVETWEAEIAS
jgi:hypothetical protein